MTPSDSKLAAITRIMNLVWREDGSRSPPIVRIGYIKVMTKHIADMQTLTHPPPINLPPSERWRGSRPSGSTKLWSAILLYYPSVPSTSVTSVPSVKVSKTRSACFFRRSGILSQTFSTSGCPSPKITQRGDTSMALAIFSIFSSVIERTFPVTYFWSALFDKPAFLATFAKERLGFPSI